MRFPSLFLYALASAALAGAVAFEDTASGAPVPSLQDQDLAERVSKLEEVAQSLTTRVTVLEAALARSEENEGVLLRRLEKSEQILVGVLDWFARLGPAGESLIAAMNSAREHGFEMAGPNPRSKTAVLEGLKSFAADLQAANPVRPPEKKNE